MSDTLLASFLTALEAVVFERLPNAVFMQVTPSPSWFTHAFGAESQGRAMTLAQAFPVLDPFLTDAEAFWHARERGVLRSEAFAVSVPEGDVLLRATVTTVGQRPLLAIERLVGLADPREMLQLAREKDLRHERFEQLLPVLRAQVQVLTGAVKTLAAAEGTTAGHPQLQVLQQAVERLAKALQQLLPPDDAPR